MPRRKQTSLNPVISRPLTLRQKKFAEEVVLGRCSQTEAARRAGYAESSAHVRGCELLDIGKFPHVANYINDLRLDLSKKYEVTYEKHVRDLGDLRDRAAANNQFSAAINAETNRGKDDLIRRLEELDRESGGSLKTIVDAEFENVSKT